MLKCIMLLNQPHIVKSPLLLLYCYLMCPERTSNQEYQISITNCKKFFPAGWISQTVRLQRDYANCMLFNWLHRNVKHQQSSLPESDGLAVKLTSQHCSSWLIWNHLNNRQIHLVRPICLVMAPLEFQQSHGWTQKFQEWGYSRA